MTGLEFVVITVGGLALAYSMSVLFAQLSDRLIARSLKNIEGDIFNEIGVGEQAGIFSQDNVGEQNHQVSSNPKSIETSNKTGIG